MDYNVANSYILVNAIAHECYHYFQFVLEQKLIKGEIEEEFKQSAYLYFICLHDKLFSSFNEKVGIYRESDIGDDDIYIYSPIELSANGFAYQIIELLGKYDLEKNFNQYRDFHSLTYFKTIQRNLINGGNSITKSINHSLQSALDFLNYKNKTSGSKLPYLGIDTKELENAILLASKKWNAKEKKEIEVYNKITKKR